MWTVLTFEGTECCYIKSFSSRVEKFISGIRKKECRLMCLSNKHVALHTEYWAAELSGCVIKSPWIHTRYFLSEKKIEILNLSISVVCSHTVNSIRSEFRHNTTATYLQGMTYVIHSQHKAELFGPACIQLAPVDSLRDVTWCWNVTVALDKRTQPAGTLFHFSPSLICIGEEEVCVGKARGSQ